jgi:CubicO group peptidase (beta-lactamase class C family)
VNIARRGLLALAWILAAFLVVVAPAGADELAASSPEDQEIDSRPLIALAEWIRDQRLPVFSVLVSRNGVLVYELYTSSLTRDHAHYLMSVTKSVVSALVGIAIDRRLIDGPDAPITRTLPPRLFRTPADVTRFQALTVRHVLGMSALDAPDPPRSRTPDALARQERFWSARNRVAFALEQPVLTAPGRAYQYNDVTPMLATGLIQYATGTTALEFAEERLFRPMGFRNHEWMHQDPTGIDNGGYGLRLRPIDMQKFGILYLAKGVWRGEPLISPDWIARSFSPWNRSRPDLPEPDYGWFWWRRDFGRGWRAHVANGWRGQRIAVFPQPRLVVTMTAYLEGAGEADRVFRKLVEDFVMPAVEKGARRRDAAAPTRLATVLEELRTTRSAVRPDGEARMTPSVERKAKRRTFDDRR